MSIKNLKNKLEGKEVSGMKEYKLELRTVTLGELRELAEINKDHPWHKHIQDIVDQWENSSPDREFQIDKKIVQGIIDNRNVEIVSEYKDGREYCTIELLESRVVNKEVKNGDK